VFADKENKHANLTQQGLTALLTQHFNFKEDYASWLPDHLEHLSKGSLMILEDLNPSHFEHVRYSTVVSFSTP